MRWPRSNGSTTTPAIDGILVQSPLPRGDGRRRRTAGLRRHRPDKDVDGFHPRNVGLLVQKRARLVACTPSGVIQLLDREGIPIAGRHAVVIGRSDIVGKPMALLLLHRDATVTICHSRTPDVAALARTGRSGRGRRRAAGLRHPGRSCARARRSSTSASTASPTPPRWPRYYPDGHPRRQQFADKGSLVIGDVHPAVEAVAGALTPVPGGVGPLTVAMLLHNTVVAAEDRAARQA